GILNRASGVMPVAKLLENAFSYSNQLGQRNGQLRALQQGPRPDGGTAGSGTAGVSAPAAPARRHARG
ncbi:MAG: hypothetical protein ABS909_06845, partial [Arthrobacter sp.]